MGQYWLLTDSIRVALTCFSPADQKKSTAKKSFIRDGLRRVLLGFPFDGLRRVRLGLP